MKCPHCGKETETKKVLTATDILFQRFQEVYPKRRGCQRWPQARKYFGQLIHRKGLDAEVLTGKAEEYYRYCHQTYGQSSEYVMQAATFLGSAAGWEANWSVETPFDQARRQLQEQT